MELDIEIIQGKTFDKDAAQRHRDQFEAYCAASKTEQGRLVRPVAIVAYGGG